MVWGIPFSRRISYCVYLKMLLVLNDAYWNPHANGVFINITQLHANAVKCEKRGEARENAPKFKEIRANRFLILNYFHFGYSWSHNECAFIGHDELNKSARFILRIDLQQLCSDDDNDDCNDGTVRHWNIVNFSHSNQQKASWRKSFNIFQLASFPATR